MTQSPGRPANDDSDAEQASGDADQSPATSPAAGPTALGGRVLMIGIVAMAVLWLVSLVQLFRLPAQGPLTTTGEAAIWTALAIASAISTFLLGVWKVHRS